MTFLPIVDRELRIGARRPSTYWMRSALGAGVCLIWFVVLTASSRTAIHTKVVILFWTVTALAFAFCLMAGALLTADCISGEKRDGTLGLLFLTDLESYDVVFGKLAATSLHASYGLLCVLPSLALCFLMGGVTAGEFWRTTAVFGVTMFLSLSIGLAISVVSRGARQAMLGTMMAMMGLAALPPLLAWLGANFAPQTSVLTDLLQLLSPACDLALGSHAHYTAAGGAALFWDSLLLQIGLGALALLLAGTWAPRVWNEETSTRATSAGERWLRFGSRLTQRRRRSLMEENPFCWLSVRDRTPTLLAWIVVLVLFIIWGVFLAYACDSAYGKNSICFIVAVFMAYGAYVLWKSFVAIEAARRITEDRQAGALELLLVTKLDVESMLEGQRRALKRMFLGPGLVVLFMNVVLLGMVAEIARPRLQSGLSTKTIFVFGVGALCVAAELASLSHAGTWIGLRARRMQYAFVGMLGRVMLLPWLGMIFLAVALITGASLSPDDMYILLLIWMLISLAVDAVMGIKCRKQLEKQFRRAAAGDFDALKDEPAAAMVPEESPQPA